MLKISRKRPNMEKTKIGKRPSKLAGSARGLVSNLSSWALKAGVWCYQKIIAKHVKGGSAIAAAAAAADVKDQKSLIWREERGRSVLVPKVLKANPISTSVRN
eukprot:1684537-Amphidinium_carterae.1